MKGKKKAGWWYKLLPIVLGVFLMAGIIGLQAPTAAQAEAATPPELTADTVDNMVNNPIEITFEDDPNWRTVISAVYVDSIELDEERYSKDTSGKIIFSANVFETIKSYNVVIKANGYSDASITQKIERVELEILGDGVETPKQYTLSHLQGMEQYRHLYSTINTWPTKNWYVAEGVKLRALLEEAGIKDEAKQIRFTSHDGFRVTFTVKELLNEQRYLFPHFKDNHEYFGNIPGSSEDAELVEPILALMSAGSTDFDSMRNKDALHLIFGQRAVTEQTNAIFAKYVAKVEVFTAEPEKWAVPTASVASGEVPEGTLVELSATSNDTDKVHYTLDGSEPTVESPMYNWIAIRWSNREDFDEINHPIEIKEDTTIKAIVIGPGKANSDVIELNYTVAGDDPVLPVVAFTADTTSGTAPLTVNFTDESTGTAPLTYAWDFDNDGVVDSTEQNPTFEYSNAGTYSVKLTVSNAAGSDEEIKTGYINVNPAPISAEILLNSNSGKPGTTVFVTGSGFDASVAGTVWFDTNDNGVLDNDEPSIDVKTDADGAIPLLTSLTVPSASTGSYNIRADFPGGIEAVASFTITDSGIIVNPTNGNAQISSGGINITGNGFTPSTGFRLFCDRNGNGLFDDGAYRSGTTTAEGTISVSNLTWPNSPTGIYNILLDINRNDTIEASASICVTPGIKISTPRGIPGTNIGMNIAGYSGNETGYVWFDTNGNGTWDEGENKASVTTSGAGTASSPGLSVPSVKPGSYQVCADIPASGLKATATYTVTGIILDTSSGSAGTSINVTGCGFVQNQSTGKYIWFDTNGNGTWDADESKVDVTTDANGIMSPVSLIAPAVPAGDYNVCAYVFPLPASIAVFTIEETPPVSTWYVDASGNGDFTTIQAAVTAASSGDTIIVKDGTYTENVDVDKSLEIRSENGADLAIVQASNPSDDVFCVTAQNVTINGFTASGATTMDNNAGIKIASSGGFCTITNNKCNGNSTGISVVSSVGGNTVSNNICTSSGKYGIYLSNTTNNSVTGNTCSNNTAGTGYALYLADNANNNTVNGNTSDSNTIGIRVKNADNNSIFNNTSLNNAYGMEIATGSIGNAFYLNNFTGNTSAQLSAGYGAISGNYWNSQAEQVYSFNDTQYTGLVGNFWSNYTGADADSNGIGDTPYQTISTDYDNYPLMGQWQDGVITVAAAAPVAAFTADITSGTAPLTVSFTDESTGTVPLTYAWDFNNDGVVDSTDQNPTYEYSNAGTYSVKLTVTNAAGSDEDVKNDYIEVADSSIIDVLYDGTVALAAGDTFNVTAYNSGTEYTVDKDTPLGALQAAAIAGGFTYDVTDKNYTNSGALLLDNIGNYPYVKGGSQWYAYVNNVYKDGYNNPAGALNLIELVDGDKVEFYYADGITDEIDLDAVKAVATAAVKTVVDTDTTMPSTWTLQLSGVKDATVTKDYFEGGLACPSSGHQVFWTDGDGNEWGGVPLWLLVAMVDDDPDVGPYHINFNDELAQQGYDIKVIAGDGWDTTLDSAAIAHNNGYIVANTLNGEPLPLKTEGGKDCWPLYLKGSAIFGGQQVGNIVRIELSGISEPPAGWTLEMIGDVGDTITQEEFEEGLACTGSGHYKEWTDNEGNVWSGSPLWVLLGAVDDIETSSHWTFNDGVAADGYTVKVVAGDGFSKTFNSTDVAKNNEYIVANKCNGEALTGSSAPIRLVGDGVAKDDGSLGGSAVGNIVRIEIPELQTPAAAPGSWNLTLNGKISDVISQAEFENALTCPNSGHLKEWTDGNGDVWSGIPLWFLAGWVDDQQPHNYDYNLANAGYTILAKAGDGYTKDFDSVDIARSDDYIIANKCNGEPLTDSWPLRLVGDGVAKDDGTLGGTSVGNIVEIELTSFETGQPQPIPEVRIIKYAEDGTTILDEKTVNYMWMERESGFDVIGDGTTVYRFEGITNNPDDVWDENETYPGGFKIENAVKGTRIRDLCNFMGGMGAGTEIVLVAKDGWETRLPYSSIYTDPSVQERQGDAILAWWADGKYVPEYADGMRLFFTPGGDNVYSQWDMHETLPENYWHYYFGDGVQYPSCAGLAAKWITEIKIYSIPQGDWTLELDGRCIGGINYDVSKTYFEQALTCQFGANHKASYTDSEGQVWEGMPLWFLAGFVDDADQHSDNAFNNDLALAGYNVVITAADGYSVTIDSADIIRNNNYIIANTLNGEPLSENGSDWPLRLVGPVVTGSTSISQIVSIELINATRPVYNIAPEPDGAYTVGTTSDGTSTMTINDGVTGFKYFTVGIEPVVSNNGKETVVFTHLRNGSQMGLNATRADFDVVDSAQAGFNVQPGDVIKAYIVDELTNSTEQNPVILQ